MLGMGGGSGRGGSGGGGVPGELKRLKTPLSRRDNPHPVAAPPKSSSPLPNPPASRSSVGMMGICPAWLSRLGWDK